MLESGIFLRHSTGVLWFICRYIPARKYLYLPGGIFQGLF